MELQDCVDLVRRRWWLLFLPLVATGLLVGRTLSQPATYSSTATVAALAVTGGGPAAQYSGTSGARSFVANFQGALLSPPVIDEVVRATGVERAAALRGLSSTAVGESTIIKVTYRTKAREGAAPVATAAAKATMTFLFRSQIDLAQGPLSDAEARLAAVDRELADFTAKASTPVPDRDYEILANQISSLQTQRAQAAATDQTVVAERLGLEIANKQQQLTQLAATLAAYNALQAKRAAAVDASTAARQLLLQASTEYAAGDPNRTVSTGETVKNSVLGAALKGAATTFVAGLFFATGIAVLLELRRRRRLARRDRPVGAVDSAPPSGAPEVSDPANAENARVAEGVARSAPRA